MFRQESLPAVAMNPQDANSAFIRGDVELVRICDAAGRVAAEGALPYPPCVLCVVPGEIWGGAVQRYFWRWKRVLTCCRASRRSYKVFTVKRMQMVLSVCMDML